jgi:hypothetical protein
MENRIFLGHYFMAFEKMRLIGHELKAHAPFTFFGAVTGIAFMLIFKGFGEIGAQTLFGIFHPLHVVLSAMVTAALFQLHRKAKNFILILVIGYVGSIGIATLSDCIIPYFGESILGAAVPTEGGMHDHEHPSNVESTSGPEDPAHEHRPALHLGFIEEWWLVNPAAVLGIVIAFFLPTTKYPHALHILVSTWASASHILMNTQADWSIGLLAGMFIALFIAVWLPCCFSDIVFPLLFVKSDGAHLGHHGCLLCSRKEKQENQSSPAVISHE